MFSLDIMNQKKLVNSIVTCEDIVEESFYKDITMDYLESIMVSNEREKVLLEITSKAIDDVFTHKLSSDIEDEVVIESYSKYIDYAINRDNNNVLEFFDYVLSDYVNNNIMNKTQKINNHSEALTFRGLNADTSCSEMSTIYESDIYDFINILNECNLLSQDFIDYYTNIVTESFITTSNECIQIISGTGITRTNNIPLSSDVMENLAFPNSDFLETTIESLTRLQDVEEISSDDISDVKELIKSLYENSYTKDDFGNGMIDNLYHKYFNCIIRIIDNDRLNPKTIKWACSNTSLALEKLYKSCRCKFTTTMIEIQYLMLIIEKTKLQNNNESTNELMYFIQRMRQILFNNNNIDWRGVNNDWSTNTGVVDITHVAEEFLSTLNLVITTLENNRSNGCVDISISNESTNRLGETDASIEVQNIPIHKSSEVVSSKDIINVLTESFEILSDGSIKVTIPKKTTYMEEYANNHRLLKENQKVKDYEAMRYNLIYHILLVESIEKKIIHNKKIDENSELYTEAVKAKSFAMNDITTYLPEVKKNLPNFDLNEFYSLVKAEKQTVKIDTIGTISGVKKILNYILLK